MRESHKIRLLIAEDDPDNGFLLKFAFSTQGLDPILVSDGVAALESIERQRPDVLLTDIEMPEKDGITLIKEVREREDSQHLNHLPIMVMSGRADRLTDAKRAGAALCFSKPMADLASIVEKIKELIHGPLISDSLCDAV